MPLQHETTSILGYYDGSWAPKPEGIRTFADGLDSLLEECAKSFERWPVLNREPRTPIDSQKRAIIHQRDGGICQLCGTGGHHLTVDHIIPRSAFQEDALDIADRSDNLVSACWPCNQAKSNYERGMRKRLGVVVRCWYCRHPEHGSEEAAFMPLSLDVPVFCGQCGTSSHAPAVKGWVL